ncbi:MULTISPECIES: tyrosine-type recombinase/integrase [unclassified Mycolicibacterium]|uniref:tyrosine-type recombinase/integrase n=1 Tax=unclassified Mycolicibacterium TaxID=2636767 RepID=UPI002EDB8ACC
MAVDRWQVRLTPTRLRVPRRSQSFVDVLPAGEWGAWLARSGVRPGTPFLLSPDYTYDVELNEFFQNVRLLASASNTQVGYARDIAGFLTFLWSSRGKRSWRNADESDHLSYLYWRRTDPDGPRVAASTWNREVAAVNRLYQWAVGVGYLQSSPIPQTGRRPAPVEAGWINRRSQDEQRPATYAHSARRHRIEWLAPNEYRRWRDVGVRGFAASDVLSDSFRGRWSARNAVFCDLMVRTGLRLSEQASLTVFEIPTVRSGGYQRFWLPASIAKGGSARWIYVPVSVVSDLMAYAAVDRRAVIDDARVRYQRTTGVYVVDDLQRPGSAVRIGSASPQRRVKVAELNGSERRSLLVDGPAGLEPALFWLGEHGGPLSKSLWSKVFADANRRCVVQGVKLSAHPHLLRHTFAVVTLEQLQRGHIASLSGMTSVQRGHYTRVFGDPLDWVRRRLGHRSVVTTQNYLHALAELEMHTRMELVPDDWDDPSSIAADDLADDES